MRNARQRAVAGLTRAQRNAFRRGSLGLNPTNGSSGG